MNGPATSRRYRTQDDCREGGVAGRGSIPEPGRDAANPCGGKIMILGVLATLGLFGLTPPSRAQVAVAASESAKISQIIDSKQNQNALKCELYPWNPFLDFTFRFQTGFLLSSNLGQFSPGEQPVTYLRVTPQGASPVLMSSVMDLPAVPKDMTRTMDSGSLRKLRITTSGAFNVGEGRYAVELVLVNRQGQSCYKHWNVQTGKNTHMAVPVAMDPRSVQALAHDIWDGKLNPNGVRLSVLFDAAPMNALSPKLHAWDRALLLETLASLLKRIPCRSVELVAFNLEQQREIYRQEKFDSKGFAALTNTLQHLELAAVSYQNLQRGSAPKFLSKLVQEQISTQTPPEVVFFLGPATRFDQKPLVEKLEADPPSFYYFELHWPGTHFPDSIEHLTKELHGSTFVITSASELAVAIQKTLARIEPTEKGDEAPKNH
jgi:hypothetical protein